MSGPELFLSVIAAYALAGSAFAVAFITVGVGRLDPAARGTSWRFRALIFPGSAALWPVLAVKWARANGGAS
ncbi:hypothetical protein VT84_23610 [Gemmata sp. SH-PL17]|uniref:Uncharacterized protein n=1 Tax=Gemmata massiliana TaxID=1210884 RepID=A0A6P2CVC1_9BACT|nr:MULTISPECIES: hypothetical protein [Gemmata]AMV27407.1 hypothetical protein VT84_23610 [Gemmata sp. SH-PL17]VTR92909.1 Uncharacterized protein OS=Acaryochloris marina (strain MBIC 11017) GN=AM1_4156 PE=4 SV=1 [Gemmata massiliana]